MAKFKYNIVVKQRLVNQDLCHGLWLAESKAVSQSDAMIQILVN